MNNNHQCTNHGKTTALFKNTAIHNSASSYFLSTTKITREGYKKVTRMFQKT